MSVQPARMGVHLALMATMVVWALNISAVKWLTGVMDIMLVASLRMVCACLVLGWLLVMSRQSFPRWRGRTLALACVSAVLMVYGNQTLFAAAMERTSATNGALILALNPLLGGLLETLFFRKRMGMNFVAGALLAVAGVCMVVLNRPHASWTGPSIGDLLVLGSMLAFASGAAVLQRLSRSTSPLAINGFLYLFGTLALLTHALVRVDSPVSNVLALGWLDWVVIVFSGALATALGAVAWGRGVAALGMGRASVYMSWVPVLGVGFGALLLNEPLTLWHLFGMTAVLLGTAISSMGLEWLPGRGKVAKVG